MQINLDKEETIDYLTSKDLKFQSYQFMQINPDGGHSSQARCAYFYVSIVSIHADQSRQSKDCKLIETYQRFQSYQFMQINPDHLTIGLTLGSNISFNRINSCRSIPTLNKAIALPRALESFNRINSCRSIPT